MEEVTLSREGPVARVWLNRPQRRNALSQSMWQALHDMFTALRSDTHVRAIIIGGEGGNFSAGADIHEFEALREDPARAHAYHALVDACVQQIMAAGKPTVAALTGHCIGGGCSIAMACDFRIASNSLRIAIPAARMGIVYSLTDTANLLALVGASHARRILYSAERYNADDALDMGFIDRIADDEPDAAAADLLSGMLDNAPQTIAGAKAMINALIRGGDSQLAADAAQAAARALASADHAEAIEAFRNRRAPEFRGL